MREVELTLLRVGSPEGEIRADRAGAIATALYELVLRLTREAADAAGLGRPPSAVERMGEVRLVGLGTREHRLVFRLGDPQALDIDPLAERTDQMLAEVVEGVTRGERPLFVTSSIAEAVGRLVGALDRAAPAVAVGLNGRLPVEVEPATVNRRLWDGYVKHTVRTRITGVLEAVDVRNGRFRLVDVEGQRYDLVEVASKEQAAALVTLRVTAEGLLVVPEGNGHTRMEQPTLRPVDPDEVPVPEVDTEGMLPGLS